MAFIAARTMLLLKAPQSPRSAVTMTSSTLRSASCAWRRGCVTSSSTRVATEVSTLRSAAAYGRAAKMRSCARRSFAAETIFMALVSCWLFLVVRVLGRVVIAAGIRYLVDDRGGVLVYRFARRRGRRG